MFGKPEWFREKNVGWGLAPVTWRGWVYALGWTLVIGLPFIVLVERHQGIEATVWLAFGLVTLVRDVKQILAAIRVDAGGDKPDVLYIGPEV